MTNSARRFTAWLCITLAALAGFAPTRGFVLCIEADGCVRLELKAPIEACGGCEPHDASDSSDASVDHGTATECACVDLSIPGTSEPQIASAQTIVIHDVQFVAPVEHIRLQVCASRATNDRGPPTHVPRVADALTHHRCIVLLV